MLVLSRKQNERIRVGDSVVVTIVRVSGDKVRIGIDAPPNVRVLRDDAAFLQVNLRHHLALARDDLAGEHVGDLLERDVIPAVEGDAVGRRRHSPTL